MKWLIPHIKNKGYLSVGEYMALCLYDPDNGYYTTRNPLGAGNDFITAPEISQMFGEMISVCISDLWDRMGRPSTLHVIELGPGRGTLMQDFLRILKPEIREAVDLHMVEISPILTEIQKESIGHPRSHWHTKLDDALAQCQRGPTIIIANEFFDALPFDQHVKNGDSWEERRISLSDDEESLVFLPECHEKIKEQCPLGISIMSMLSTHLRQYGGMALIIDYGYIGPSTGDSLQAVQRHKYHELLKEPGKADLTAHVDFSSLKNTALAEDVSVYGPTTQSSFLVESGIAYRFAKLASIAQSEDVEALKSGLLRLIAPDQMGELFKVLAICGKDTPNL